MPTKPVQAAPKATNIGRIAAEIFSGAIKKGVMDAVVTVAHDDTVKEIKPADAAPVAGAVLDALAKNPQFVNATNSESPIQSRVGVGGAVGVVGALGILVPIAAQLFGYQFDPGKVVEIGAAIMALWGPLYALYGRFRGGMKPLFSKAG